MDDFNKIAEQYFVDELESLDCSNYVNGIKQIGNQFNCLIPLGIFQRRSAIILNYMLNMYRVEKDINVEGWQGGFLIKGGCRFFINSFNEVVANIIIYDVYKNRIKYTINSVGQFSLLIRKHLKNLCAHFLNRNFPKDYTKIKIYDNSKVIIVTKEEIELLRNYFYNEKNISLKDDKKYLIDKIIGSPLNNQFAINAIEIYQKNIEDLRTEEDFEFDRIEEEYQKKLTLLVNKRSKNRDNCRNKFKTKKLEILKKINELKNNL